MCNHGERAHIGQPGHIVNAQQEKLCMSTVLTPNLMCSTLQVAPQFFLTPGVKEGPSPVQGHKTEKAQEVKFNGSQAEATLRPCLSDTRTCIPNRFPLLLKCVGLEYTFAAFSGFAHQSQCAGGWREGSLHMGIEEDPKWKAF